MEVLYRRWAGLDVEKVMLVACIRCVSEPVHKEVKTFETTTRSLLELNAWLTEWGVEQVAMEATGVYWKPVCYLLEDDFELTLAACSRASWGKAAGPSWPQLTAARVTPRCWRAWPKAKRRSTRTRKGDPWLKTALVGAAWAASRKGCRSKVGVLR